MAYALGGDRCGLRCCDVDDREMMVAVDIGARSNKIGSVMFGLVRVTSVSVS
jgi:hypothetical protein